MEGDDKFRMICAFCRFCHGTHAEKFRNSKEYEKYRLLWHKELGERMKGRKMNPDSIKRAIETKKRNGFKHTEETKEILRQKAKEQFASVEARRRMSEKILTYFSTHPGRGPKGHKFGPYSEERKIKMRNAIINSEKWQERYYNVMCIETGELFSQSALSRKLNIERHKLKTLIIKEEEINGKHYKFIK